MDHAALEHFIRETLGCGCPAEVLSRIETEPASGWHDGALLVGGRLLVLCLTEQPARRLENLLRLGRARRDAEGYNRLRLVLLTADPAACAQAEQVFSASPERDERTHLHCIPPHLFSVRL